MTTPTLASWTDGPTKDAIVAIVQRVCEEGGPDYVPPADRIAVFDNDGTLWCELPMQVWAEPFVQLRLPKFYNLRTDPYEHADITSNTYWQWVMERAYIILSGTTLVGMFLQTFNEFPPQQVAPSFTIDQAMEKMRAAVSGAMH